MKSEVVSILQQLNFTEYEAKAYLALLEKAPLSGYAISLNSGVPRSKIYEVLSALVSRGDILVSQESTPQYLPLPPDELIARRKHRAENTYHVARKALRRFAVTAQHRETIWNIAGHEAIIARVRDEIGRAERRVLLEVWSDDALELRDALEEAARKGVKILIVAYGALDFPFATVYQHYMPEEITAEYGGRWIVSSIDDREIIAGIVSLGAESRAAWTGHPGLVMPITEVIIHDIYIMEIMSVFGRELEAKFGPNLTDLRRKFLLEPNGKKHYLPLD
ncbi:TrmB family transcriptional regulator [Anaeroselena agilis]|uniref:TrmB family transcriptional regulator n=1 Tax=Anaeroselena agilis TaxID=3063788 RepID=A0ABU3P2D2_9FIRM|nr:TrmB family transcriptional regulator [Selenomonadales bacterium 4137-cl]